MQGIPVVPGLAGGRKFRDLRFVIPQKVVTDDGSVLRRRVRGLFERRKRGQNDDDNNNKLAGYNYGKMTPKHVGLGVESCSQSPNSHSLRGTRRSKTWFRDSLSSKTSFTMLFFRIAASTSQNFVTSGSSRLISRVKIHDASSHGFSTQKWIQRLLFFWKKFPLDKIQVVSFFELYTAHIPLVDFASGWRKIQNTF